MIATPATPGENSSCYAGIPKTMAVERKKAVSNVTYALSFDIPENPDSAITGAAIITFDYAMPHSAQMLPIDFAKGAERLSTITVNRQRIIPTLSDDHILIPTHLLRPSNNVIEAQFCPDPRPLNRRDDYLYSLFVPARAHEAFPCFDQPDMKASFQLQLTVADQWQAVTNSRLLSEHPATNGRKTLIYDHTEPLSTYLFAFTAGRFNHTEYTDGRHTIGAYHRETDSARIAQLPEIFSQVCHALDWNEQFTGREYPFAKYDLVILPGFQFGGMEHTGATFYNDNSLFLGTSPTPDDIMRRTQLIAHETTHMWFGDYVTMRWFDDVWTKEVFANYFAAAITRDFLTHFDHNLEWMRRYKSQAMADDRTLGRTSIRQQLNNLSDAGLVYNNIIYEKAPVMLAKLTEYIGEDAFREGIRKYVAAFPYSNADWDELMAIFQSCTPKDVELFSNQWVYTPGCPVIDLQLSDDVLTATQNDMDSTGKLWPQRLEVAVLDADSVDVFELWLDGQQAVSTLQLPHSFGRDAVIIPDYDGMGYGLFTTSLSNIQHLLSIAADGSAKLPATARLSLLMNLNECYLAKHIGADQWLNTCLDALSQEPDVLTALAIAGYISEPLCELPPQQRPDAEQRLLSLAESHSATAVRKALVNLLAGKASTPEVIDSIYALWRDPDPTLLSERDLMSLSYLLALHRPSESAEIISPQRSRLSNPDRIREFDFISRAVNPDTAAVDSLFRSFAVATNRSPEPWVGTSLRLIMHTLRGASTVSYIRPALELLPEIQRTGDIFFPANWCKALLSGQRSPEAAAALQGFLDDNRNMKPLLRNKIMTAAYLLLRAQ